MLFYYYSFCSLVKDFIWNWSFDLYPHFLLFFAISSLISDRESIVIFQLIYIKGKKETKSYGSIYILETAIGFCTWSFDLLPSGHNIISNGRPTRASLRSSSSSSKRSCDNIFSRNKGHLRRICTAPCVVHARLQIHSR